LAGAFASGLDSFVSTTGVREPFAICMSSTFARSCNAYMSRLGITQSLQFMSFARGRWDPIDVEVDTPAGLGLKEGDELRVVPSANKYGAVSGALYRLNMLLVRGILSPLPVFCLMEALPLPYSLIRNFGE
jgi:hypothetical protein